MPQTRAEKRRVQHKNAKKGNGSSPLPLNRLTRWWTNFKREKSPILLFLLRFSAVMVPFYIFWWTDFFKAYILAPWNQLNATVAGALLNLFGAETTAEGVRLSSDTASISILEGCDGIEPTMLLVAGIVAFPAARSRKLKGVLYGAAFLLGMNFLRIVSLFIAAESWPEGFEFLHREFWQVVFILLAILTWAFWLSRLPKPEADDQQ